MIKIADVVAAAAARFDERPIERASIEARRELAEVPLRGFAPQVWKLPLWLLFPQGVVYLMKTGDPSELTMGYDHRGRPIEVRAIDQNVNRDALARMFPFWNTWCDTTANGSRWAGVAEGLEWRALDECAGEIPWR